MNRHHIQPARLAATLVIAGLVAVACGRGSSPARNGQPAQSTAPQTAVASVPAATATPSPSLPGATPEATSTPTAPVAEFSAPALSDDPVTGELGFLDQLLGNVNNAISGSDAGGE